MKLWHKIKRNPVVNFFLLAAVTQIAADAPNGEIDETNIVGYVVTVFLGIAARQFTVPAVEHEDLEQKFSEVNRQVQAENERNLDSVVKRMREGIKDVKDFE